jgi:hypothetical protein
VKSLGGVVKGTDLKTLAQFNLLGDPALTPVEAVIPMTNGAETKLVKPAKKGLAGVAATTAAGFLVDRFTREDRRDWMRQYSAAINTLAAVVGDAVVESIASGKKSGLAGSPAMATFLRNTAAEMGLVQPTVLRFPIDGRKQARGAGAKASVSKAKGATASLPAAHQVHLVAERQPAKDGEKVILIRGFEAIEFDGVVTVRKFVSR